MAIEPFRGGWAASPAACRRAVAVVALAVMTGIAACSDSPGSGGGSGTSVAAVASASGAESSAGSASEGGTPSVSVSMPSGLSAAERKAAVSAVEAYRQYVQVFDEVQQGGGENVDLLSSVATYTALDDSKYEAALLRKAKARQIGNVVIARASVSSVNLQPQVDKHELPEVVLLSCEDASKADYLDNRGKSIRKAAVPRFWDTRIWVRSYPGGGSGVDGWVVARLENSGAASC